MLNLGTPGLIAAYVLIAALLLGISIYSNWSWKIKATVIIITTTFYCVTYFSYPQILGWPTSEPPPQRFRLLASYIEQPDKQRGVSGAIYLWLARIDDLSLPVVPRAYRFPYSANLYARVLNASSKLSKGIVQLGEFEGSDDMPADRQKKISGSNAESVNIIFYDMLDTMFPER